MPKRKKMKNLWNIISSLYRLNIRYVCLIVESLIIFNLIFNYEYYFNHQIVNLKNSNNNNNKMSNN